MAELDGVWDVERTGGALPPMWGVRKRIDGNRGRTLVGRMPLWFDVRGHELHYGGALTGLVDRLAPEGDGFTGRATFRGAPIGTFRLRRVTLSEQLNGQLIKHIDEALAMEQNVARMLDSMVQTTDDPEIKEALRQHKLETEQHADRMQQRLEAHGASPSMVREAGGIVGALMKGVMDVARPEKAGRNARDGYATEHMEIASYQLLERIARRAGDEETAVAAAQNRADEEKMATVFEQHWDRFADLSLQEQGIVV